jgi:hypothetical protein
MTKKTIVLVVVALLAALLVPIRGVSAPQKVLAASDDDGSYEVGVEWVDHYDSLPDSTYNDENAGWFYNTLGSAGWVKRFNYGNNDAWPLDWTRDTPGTPSWNGYDVYYADKCDIAWFSGHGAAGLLDFNYCPTEPYSDGEPLKLISNCNYYYTSWPSGQNEHPTYDEARWGDSDLEWVFLDACDCLQNIHSGTYKSYVHFGWALNRAHLICGCTNTIWDYAFGDYVAYYLLGWMPGYGALPVINSWYMGAKEVEYGVTLRCIGETSACLNDYIWGKGSVCSDPTVDNYLVIWDINV